MQYDFVPVRVDDFFTPSEYESVYQTINNSSNNNKFNVEDTGYIAIVEPLNNMVLDRIVNTAIRYTEFNLKNAMTHIARYTHKSKSTPMLRPHYDVMLTEPSITISIQLDSTLDWKLFVENQSFELKKNSAAIFSGSHQIHWRPPIKFEENDYFDVMVCQLYDNAEVLMILTDEHKNLMKQRSDKWNIGYDKLYS